MSQFKKAVSLVLTIVMMAGAVGFSALAAEKPVASVLANAESMDSADFNPKSDEAQEEIKKKDDRLPSSIDLRNYNGKNYVTPVKKQNPFGSCWAFAMAAAAEISYLYDNDMGVPAGEPNNGVDFSEKYINWYMFHHITEDDVLSGAVPASQVGEGMDFSEPEKKNRNVVYDKESNGCFGVNFYASGMGPVTEDTEIDGWQPYLYAGRNRWQENTPDSGEITAARRQYYYEYFYREIDDLIENGVIANADEFDSWFEKNWQPGKPAYDNTHKGSSYVAFDDWTLPLTAKYRFPEIQCFFKEAHALPCPASRDKDDNYAFSEAGLAAMKSELSKGRGISIGILADQSEPGQKLGDGGYLNTENWAQYNPDSMKMNHLVTVVGYDDNYPKENFTRTYQGEIVKGSTPPADGAFIVKNSWGAITEEDKANATTDSMGNTVYENPNAGEWGIDNTGYFYLSYYDHTINSPQTYEFYTDDEVFYDEMNYNQYDLLQETEYKEISYPFPVSAANVFTAEEDEYLTQLSTMVASPWSRVHYEVYSNPGETPDSGKLLAQGDLTFDYAGYQRINLGKAFFLKKGDRYSVIISTQTVHKDGQTKNIISVPLCENDHSKNGVTVNSVINPGESYLKIRDWEDMSAEKASLEKLIYDAEIAEYDSEESFRKTYVNGLDDFKIDNNPIKTFTVPARTVSTLLGDTDWSSKVDISDATFIQRADAGLIALSEVSTLLGDVDRDGETSIIDVTWIQRREAKMKAPYGIGKPIYEAE